MKYSVVYAIVYTPYSCVLHKCHTRIAYHCIPLYAIAYRCLHTIVYIRKTECVIKMSLLQIYHSVTKK